MDEKIAKRVILNNLKDETLRFVYSRVPASTTVSEVEDIVNTIRNAIGELWSNV